MLPNTGSKQSGSVPPGITSIAEAVLEKRYRKRDRHGQVVETIVQMFERVADNIAQATATMAPPRSRWRTRRASSTR